MCQTKRGKIVKVVRYDNGHYFGFIVEDNTDTSVYFSKYERREAYIAGNEVLFGKNDGEHPIPVEGDRVVFIKTMGERGLKTVVWDLEENAQLPQMYRIVKAWFNLPGKAPAEAEVLWEGMQLNVPGMENFYHPRFPVNPDSQGRTVGWHVSSDGGATWTETACPKIYATQFGRQGCRKIPQA